MADLIPANGYVAVFTGLNADGKTTYHHRPLICWTVGEDGAAVGQYIHQRGRPAVASAVPNFFKYMTEDEWARFEVQQYRLSSTY